MLNMVKRKQKTIAEKVSETILHPNESGSASDSGEDTTIAKVVEYEHDEYELPQAGTTEFRKRNVKFLSEQNEKYKGKIVSRKDFDNESSEENEEYEKSDSSENEEASTIFTSSLKGNLREQNADIIDSDTQESEDNGMELGDDDNDSSDLDSESVNENHEVITRIHHENEIQKGLSVQNQLFIWERLLELRINIQKILNKSNLLPPPQELKDLERNNNKYKDLKESTCKQTFQLLQNLLSLKSSLTSQFPEMEKAMKISFKRPLSLDENNFGEPPLKKVDQFLEDGLKQFRSYRNDVLVKWDDRTKLLQPGAGSKKNAFNEEYDIVKKIESILVNKSLLIEKSQQIKNSAQNDSTQENIRIPNIYDDSDFYHQQLRELIEYKANTTSNMSDVTKQFLELQKIRHKMKKKVDTRASKGRKLRYIIHNKLINFMAPNDNSTWTMESVDELSKSLFV